GAEVSLGERARQMIAQTIRQHLRKEMEFAFSGLPIKVLSLFFLDTVAKYREYDADGVETAIRRPRNQRAEARQSA
ncbi:hypothetical protein IAE22_36135, partial [Bacillus sp. S34]|nr:hypothetical protein [Bacillus sp. S34]